MNETSNKYPSPNYLLGALATDQAPMRLSVKLARGYAAALEDLDAYELHQWMQATAETCLSRGWQESTIALLTSESEERRPFYERRATEYLKEATRG